MKICILLLLLVLPSLAVFIFDSNESDSDEEVPQSTQLVILSFLFTTIVLPSCLKWATSAINNYYAKQDTDTPSQEVMHDMSERVKNRINYWGEQIEHEIKSLKAVISEQFRKLDLDRKYTDYENMAREIKSNFVEYARAREDLENFVKQKNKENLDRWIDDGHNLELPIAEFHDTGFQTLLEAAQMIAQQDIDLSMKRSIIFRYYIQHVGILLKGFMAQTFALDISRFYYHRNETLEQKVISDQFNERVKKTTNDMLKVMKTIDPIKHAPENYASEMVTIFDPALVKDHGNNIIVARYQTKIESNRILTGFQFIRIESFNPNRFSLAIKLREAELQSNGAINPSTQEWMSMSDFQPIMTVDAFYFDPISDSPGPDYVVTGLYFANQSSTAACIEVQYHKFNYTTGKLDVGDVKTLSNCHGNSANFPVRAPYYRDPLTFEMSPIINLNFKMQHNTVINQEVLSPEIYAVNFEHYMELASTEVGGIVNRHGEIY